MECSRWHFLSIPQFSRLFAAPASAFIKDVTGVKYKSVYTESKTQITFLFKYCLCTLFNWTYVQKSISILWHSILFTFSKMSQLFWKHISGTSPVIRTQNTGSVHPDNWHLQASIQHRALPVKINGRTYLAYFHPPQILLSQTPPHQQLPTMLQYLMTLSRLFVN